MERLAIVILNWNGAAMLRQYLPIVLQHSSDEGTVYVADNGSTDDSLSLLREHFPMVPIIELGKNWASPRATTGRWHRLTPSTTCS